MQIVNEAEFAVQQRAADACCPVLDELSTMFLELNESTERRLNDVYARHECLLIDRPLTSDEIGYLMAASQHDTCRIWQHGNALHLVLQPLSN
jgi:hypothetical protein